MTQSWRNQTCIMNAEVRGLDDTSNTFNPRPKAA